MRGLPIQNRSTTMWLLCGLGVLIWVALSMLLSASAASASEAPALRTTASTHVIAPAGPDTRATPRQGDRGHDAAPQQPGTAHRGVGTHVRQHVQPEQGGTRSTARTPSATAAVRAQPTVTPALPSVADPAQDVRAQLARGTDARKPSARGITGQRHARMDGVRGHQSHVGQHRIDGVESHRADRSWRGASVDPASPDRSRTDLHAHGAATTALSQPPTVVQQPVSAEDEATAPPIPPFPGQRTGNYPWSSAVQASGSGSPFALDAAAAALPPLPTALLSHRLLHADDAPPTGPADSTESFPD